MSQERSQSSIAPSIEEAHKLSGPRPLNYDLRERKKAIAICWGMIIFDSCILAVALFYPLWYGTSMSKTNVMTVVSCLVGIVSLGHFAWRGYVLVKTEWKRPTGGGKWQFDAFQWVFAIGVAGVTLELTFGTIPDYPIIGLLSMPTATVMFLAAGIELLFTLCYFMNLRLPIDVSSLSKGDYFRPGVYTIIEDVVAVDGSGGRAFREALDERYRTSPQFRRMLVKLSLFWSIPALVVAGAVTAIVWTVSVPVAFGIGWCVPFIWAGIWTLTTFIWVPSMLRKERRSWKIVSHGP